MKRTGLILAALAVLAAAGWGGLWYMGRGEIDSRIDKAVAEAEARGWTLTWSGKAVEGFPFGYRVRLSDAALVSRDGVLLRAGEVVMAPDEAASGTLVALLPPEMSLTIPVGEMTRHDTPLLPPAIQIAIASQGLSLAVAGTGAESMTLGLTGESLRAVIDQQDFPIQLAVEALGFDAGSDPDAGARRFRLQAAGFGIDLRDLSGPGPSVVDSRYTDLSIGGTVDATGVEDFLEKLAAMHEKLVDGAFQSSAQTIVVAVPSGGEAGGRPLSLTWRAGAQTGLFALDGGTIAYESEDRDIKALLEVPGAGGVETYAGGALFYQRRVEVPVVRTGNTPRPGALRIAVEDFAPDEATWKAFDPAGVLEHTPADLVLDATGTMRLMPGGGTGPVELSNVSLSRFSLAALGATAEASGDIEILQPINLALGEIKVVLTGAGALIDKLRRGAIVDEETAETADAILQVYARPDESADRHETEISFTNDGLRINGRGLNGSGGPPPATPVAPVEPATPGPEEAPNAREP